MEYQLIDEPLLPQLCSLYIEAFNAPPWNDGWTTETIQKRLTQMMHCEGFYGLACFEEGVLCGMLLGNHEQFYDGMHFNIKEFCVRHSLRGSGIGTSLLAEFERRLLEHGIDVVYLCTSRTDETEAFYQKRGFTSWNGMVMMGKSLHS